MNRTAHRIYIFTLAGIVVVTTLWIAVKGIPYYRTPLTERFYHPSHDLFKPSGLLGHGMGIFGSLFMLVGVVIYMARKRLRSFSRLGQIKHWLEFHIFLCTLGPILVLFHTAFKFGGLVAISFWSMVAVVLSGVIGRFIYIQIPRTIEGRVMSLSELQGLREEISTRLTASMPANQNFDLAFVAAPLSPKNGGFFRLLWNDLGQRRSAIGQLKQQLKEMGVGRSEKKQILKMVKYELALTHRIKRLKTMKKIFRYWHVAHLPFAIVMLVIMLIHIAVTLAFGNFWIF